jgi:hypothetical protein
VAELKVNGKTEILPSYYLNAAPACATSGKVEGTWRCANQIVTGGAAESRVRVAGWRSIRRETDGVECDVVFSTTRDAFTDDELALFRRYYENSAEWEQLRRAPILLTAGQLDFHRHTAGAGVPAGVGISGGSGFTPLVMWSTRELIGPPAPAA